MAAGFWLCTVCQQHWFCLYLLPSNDVLICSKYVRTLRTWFASQLFSCAPCHVQCNQSESTFCSMSPDQCTHSPRCVFSGCSVCPQTHPHFSHFCNSSKGHTLHDSFFELGPFLVIKWPTHDLKREVLFLRAGGWTFSGKFTLDYLANLSVLFLTNIYNRNM